MPLSAGIRNRSGSSAILKTTCPQQCSASLSDFEPRAAQRARCPSLNALTHIHSLMKRPDSGCTGGPIPTAVATRSGPKMWAKKTTSLSHDWTDCPIDARFVCLHQHLKNRLATSAGRNRAATPKVGQNRHIRNIPCYELFGKTGLFCGLSWTQLRISLQR